MIRFRFNYRLYSIGWADGTLSAGWSSVTVTASYLGDALGDLLKAVIAVLRGSDHADCAWWQEPGEVRWNLDRQGTGVRLSLVRYPEDCPPPEAEGRLIFATTQPLRHFATEIADEAQAVLDEHGLDGYLAKWLEHPFPVEQLATIRALLTDPARAGADGPAG